jgi:hypothetical protein
LRVTTYHPCMARKKSTLERQLEESIRRAKKGTLRKPSALSDRLRAMDDEDLPDSLANPDDYPDDE